MPKRGRNIPFHKEMAVPGKSIPRDWHKEQKPPAKNHWTKHEEDRNKCAREMPAPCGWFWVLIHIKGPELFQAPEIHIFQRKAKWNPNSEILLTFLQKPFLQFLIKTKPKPKSKSWLLGPLEISDWPKNRIWVWLNFHRNYTGLSLGRWYWVWLKKKLFKVRLLDIFTYSLCEVEMLVRTCA